MSSKVFRTESLGLAAYLVTAGFVPEIVRAEDLRRALIEFKETEELRQAIVSNEGGMKEGWLWMLSPKSAKKDEDSQEKNMALFGNLGALRRDNEVTCSS